MSKHTPGPWTVGLRGEYGTHNANVIFSNGGESSVATVYHLPVHTKLEEVDPRYAKGMANARLIASAPELLDALKDVVALWDHHCHAHGDGTPTPLHVKARAAIVKAGGNDE